MVTSTLTEEKIKAGENLVREADSLKMNINAALWLYFQEQEDWKLMISIKGLDKLGPKSTYNKLQKLISKVHIKEQISLSEIALIKPQAPMLDLLRTMVRTGPGISGIRFTGNVINGQLIPDAYIYRII